ncbi:hypothetical protein LIA77_08018 [Sarocladium implicatum]|nr:hypothetical protein LIA77_08018 [Sarocladium implicatum]
MVVSTCSHISSVGHWGPTARLASLKMLYIDMPREISAIDVQTDDGGYDGGSTGQMYIYSRLLVFGKDQEIDTREYGNVVLEHQSSLWQEPRVSLELFGTFKTAHRPRKPRSLTMTPFLTRLLVTILFLLLLLCSSSTAIPAHPTTTPTPSQEHDTTPTKPFAQATKAHIPRDGDGGLSIPPYTAIVTAPPNNDAALASLGWYQTTYYECRTRAGKEHCGWHVPVRKSAGVRRFGRGEAMKAMVVLGVVIVLVELL